MLRGRVLLVLHLIAIAPVLTEIPQLCVDGRLSDGIDFAWEKIDSARNHIVSSARKAKLYRVGQEIELTNYFSTEVIHRQEDLKEAIMLMRSALTMFENNNFHIRGYYHNMSLFSVKINDF
jgi:hypothetical protein